MYCSLAKQRHSLEFGKKSSGRGLSMKANLQQYIYSSRRVVTGPKYSKKYENYRVNHKTEKKSKIPTTRSEGKLKINHKQNNKLPHNYY